MPKQVIFEIALSVERLIASVVGALVGFLVLVRLHVDFKALVFAEGFAAVRVGAAER